MLLMRGVRAHHRAIASHGLRGGVRADGPETQLMLMMLVLGGGVPTAENLVNTECFVGPHKNAPKIAHFTRSNGFVPTTAGPRMPLRALGVLLLGVWWGRKHSSTYNRRV